jgi:hypothetical protein
MINDAFFFTTVKTMGISHLLVCLRRAFVKRGDLEPMPENSGADASEVSISNNSLSSIDFFSPLFLLTRVFKRCKRETKTLVEMVVFEIWNGLMECLMVNYIFNLHYNFI